MNTIDLYMYMYSVSWHLRDDTNVTEMTGVTYIRHMNVFIYWFYVFVNLQNIRLLQGW